MMHVAKSILHDASLAEDAVSETFAKLMHNMKNIFEIPSLRTQGYVTTITKNAAFNILKKQKNCKENGGDSLASLTNGNSTADDFAADENCNRIIEAIGALPKKLADVLFMSAIQGYKNIEIAKILNINRNVAKERLSRSKKAVRKILLIHSLD
jgi:RNA polymerase sigma-70 factor (ECF subfamily)